VSEAGSGEQALALAARAKPDAVTIDYELPDTDGLALAGKLRALPGLASVPLILITSKEFAGGCSGTPLPHVTAYLSKEDIADELLPCVETHLAGR
jgi:CheY-like chemotaxis protein